MSEGGSLGLCSGLAPSLIHPFFCGTEQKGPLPGKQKKKNNTRTHTQRLGIRESVLFSLPLSCTPFPAAAAASSKQLLLSPLHWHCFPLPPSPRQLPFITQGVRNATPAHVADNPKGGATRVRQGMVVVKTYAPD